MPTRYQVRIKDTAGVQVALLDRWDSLSYSLRINGVDSHTLALAADQAAVALFDIDSQVEVYRRDIDANPPIPWTLDYEGFHRTPHFQTYENGRETFTSYGRGYDDLLARRTIRYPSESAGAAKTGPGETVIKEFVDENAGPGATAPPRITDGVTAGLTVEADGAAGAAWEGQRAYRGLLDVLQEIAKATAVDYRTVGVGAALFQFRAKAYPWGDDRSTTGLNPVTGLNAAGNAPVVFSLSFGNMKSASYSLSRIDEVNDVLVLGQGLEALRATSQRTDATAIAISPWNQRESTRNANQEATSAALDAVGDAALLELMAVESFTFQAMQTPATLYGRNYFLGDIVTARYRSVEKDFQIVGVTVSVASGRETIALDVANVVRP